MFTFRELKKFNTIELVEGDEDIILDFYKSLPYKFTFNFILFEGVIKSKCRFIDTNLIEYRYFRYNEENKILHIEYYAYANYKFAHQYTIDLDLEISARENHRYINIWYQLILSIYTIRETLDTQLFM